MTRVLSLVHAGRKGLGVFLVLAAFGGTAGAVDVVPELSPGSMASALTLLTAGLFLVAGRARRK